MEGNREKHKKEGYLIVRYLIVRYLIESHRFVKVRNIHRMEQSCSPFPLPGQQNQTKVSKYLGGEVAIQSAKGLKGEGAVSSRIGSY